jgi:hypothetical protein
MLAPPSTRWVMEVFVRQQLFHDGTRMRMIKRRCKKEDMGARPYGRT